MLPYVRNPSLWPVLVALLGHVVIVIAPLMLAVWRVGSVAAGVVLVALAALTLGACVVEARALKRPGGVGVSLALTWAAALGVAWLAESTGFL